MQMCDLEEEYNLYYTVHGMETSNKQAKANYAHEYNMA